MSANRQPETPHSAAQATPQSTNTTSLPPHVILELLQELQQSVNIITTRMEGLGTRMNAVEQGSPYLPDASRINQTDATHPSPLEDQQHVDNTNLDAQTTRAQDNTTHPSQTLGRGISTPIPRPSGPTIPTPPSPSRAVQAFREAAKEDKIAFRKVLGALGLRVSDILNNLEDDDIPETGPVSDILTQARANTSPSRASSIIGNENNQDAASTHGNAQQEDASLLSGLTRPLVCKPELLGTFHGQPDALAGFLSRVRDVLRSNTHPAWEAAVVRSLTLAMKDDAAAWHEGMSDDEAARLATVDDWLEAMRDEFPINASVQRRLARDRKWEFTQETAGGYYHQKLKLLRQAFGYDQSEVFLVTELKDGLPATMRENIRLPDNPTLRDLRKELNDREPTWREVHESNERRPPISRASPAVPSRVTSSSLVRSASAPGLPVPGAGPTSSASSPPGVLSLSATYDPSRVTPASNGQARTYKRPDNDRVMVLNRPCGRCQGDHFTFEHQHVAPQVRYTALDDDDYPVLEGDDSGDDSEQTPVLATVRASTSKGKSRVVDDGSHGPSSPSSTPPGSGLASSRYKKKSPQSASNVPPEPTASLHFAKKEVFCQRLNIPPMETIAPLARATHRYGNVVAQPAAPATGTGKGHQDHIPLTARIRINGTDSRALPSLVDTGASLSTIDAELLRQLGGRPHGQKLNITGLGQTRTRGWTTITFFIDAQDPLGKHTHMEFTHDFHVIPDFAPGLCLGNDFIGQHDLTISPVRGRARIGRFTFEVVERVGGPYAKDLSLVVSEDTVLEPGFQSWVPVGTASLIPEVDYVVYPRLSISPDETVRLAGPTTLLRHQPRSHILLRNHGVNTFVLRKGTIVADASAARAGDVGTTTGQSFTLQAPPRSPEPSAPIPSAGDPVDAIDADVAMPLDAFEGTEPPGSALVQEAETVMVDDVFRVGVQSDGQAHPSVAELLRKHHDAFALDGRPGRVRGFDMGITLQPDAVLRPEAPRRASPEKRAAMDAAIDQLLDWDVIEPSSSSISFPVLMVRQYGKWRFCVDYRQLNTHTVPDRYPLPTVDAIFQTLCGKKWFSALDAIRGYHQLGIKSEDRWKTAFVCHRGLFQYKMVPFGLRNAPAIFQRLMDSILGPLRWHQAVVYIDDSVIATDTLDEHIKALDTLLSSAEQVGLKFSPAKCTFAVPSLTLLGRKVSGAGIAIWSERAKAIQDLPRPTTLQELYHVLGLFGYYRAFIHHFAKIAEPLTRLLRGWKYESHDGHTRLVNTEGRSLTAGAVPLQWTDDQQRSFETLRDAIANPPTLAHPDPSKPYLLYVDASKSALAAILHQIHASEVPSPPSDPVLAHLHHLDVHLMPPTLARERWREWLLGDRCFASILRKLESDPESDDTWALRDGLLIRRVDDRLALPTGALPTVLRAVHDDNGHFGFMKTYLALARSFWRPNLSVVARAWVKHCSTCQTTKQVPKTGSLDVSHDPSFPFATISIDIILGLPTSRGGNNAALAILDVFSRMLLLTPCSKDITAEGVAAIVSDRILRMGWRPTRIITDSEAKMSGSVMSRLATSLGASLTPSTPYHQQANAVERAIQTAQHVLQALSTSSKAHWDRRALPAAELAINSTPSLTTGYRPLDLVFISPPDLVHALFDANEHLGVDSFEERLAAAVHRLAEARAAIARSRLDQKRRYDARRAALPALQPGDHVFIRLRDRPLPGAIRDKLDPRKLGPFLVVDVLSPHRARVRLPAEDGGDTVFNVEQLDMVPREADPFALDRTLPPPLPAESRIAPPSPSAESVSDADPLPLDAPLPPRIRQLPSAMRDFHLGVVQVRRSSDLEEALRTPIGRPRYLTLGDQEVVLTERPVAFLSRLTTVTEAKLVASELELCCFAWAFHKLAHLLEGADVTVITDHSPMEKMLRSTTGIAYGPTISRCRAILMPHLPNLRFIYRPGSRHTNVDALSRIIPAQGRSELNGGHVQDGT